MSSTSPFAVQAKALVARFRRQKPLRAGSLLVTILGDAIAPRGGTIALSSLIELAQPFGLTDRLVRTSVGRLANEGWVSSERSGRSSYYTLTPNGKARFAEATQRIYAMPQDAWNGEWSLVIVPPTLKGRVREQLRDELYWLGFGELNSSIFAHPTHGEDTIRARLAELEASGQLVVIQRAVVTQASDAQLVAMGWDFAELERRYRRFIGMFEAVDEAASATGARVQTGETAFILRTLLLHEYRKIHLRDPLLPTSLLPPQWVGTDALELCRRLYAKVFQASERYLSATVQTMSGPLPQPSRAILARFGGLPSA